MASAVLVFAALALLCAAFALLLWQRGAQRKDEARAERYIDSRMAMPAGVAAGGMGMGSGAPTAARANPTRAAATHAVIAPQAPPADADWLAYWRYLQARARFMVQHAMARAGMANAKAPAALAGTMVLLLCGWAALVGGALAACVALIACVMFFYFLLTMRVNKRRQQIVRQLPLFLDGIVRLITLGNSVPAAFQAALQTTEAPLRE